MVVIESVTHQFFELQEHHAEQITAAGSTNNLESQLADLRKAVSLIQVEILLHEWKSFIAPLYSLSGLFNKNCSIDSY